MRFLDLPGIAHTRVEYIERNGFSAVTVVIDGIGRFEAWDEFRDEHTLKIASQRSYARSLGALVDFVAATSERYRSENGRHRLFRDFADALVVGTVQCGADDVGLWWFPRSQKVARRVISEVSAFLDWLAERKDVQTNSSRRASIAEQLKYWHSWNQWSRRRLLAHLSKCPRADAFPQMRRTQVRGNLPYTLKGDKKEFPDSLLVRLLRDGFCRSGKARWSALRDRMIVLLMHEGGLRLSEVLHIWVTDVFADPADSEQAVVRVYHPSDGLIQYDDARTGRSNSITRSQYLRLVYDRAPLTEAPGKRRVGWKDPLLTNRHDRYLHVFWRSVRAARLFMSMFTEYMQIRPRASSHPYVFIATGGNTMTEDGFEKVHSVAIRRLGLAVGKNLGTTPYGHRHAYGKYLRRIGMDKKVIQIAMHHKSVLSQEVYTEADAEEASAALRRAADKLAFDLDDIAF